MLKVEELSRSKLTEDFEAVSSFFQGSSVKTVPQPWRQRREVPRCWDWRRAHQEFTGFTTVPSGARSKCEPFAGFITHKEKACFNVHRQFFASTAKPVTGCHKKANPTKSWTTNRSGSFLERQGNNCSQKQNPRSWDMNTERILPKIIFVNWRDKLILKQWKLGILQQGMNSPDENKLYFTKNWQIENEHFVILVFKSWKNWREIRNFASRNFREKRKVENLFTDVESVRSDNYFAFPVNQRYFFFLVNQEDCWAATKICSQICGIRMIYQETFLDGLHASTSTTFSGMLNSRDFSVTCNIPMQASTGKPVTESGDRDHNQSWAKMAKITKSLKRPSTGILTLFQQECIQRIKEPRSFSETLKRERL